MPTADAGRKRHRIREGMRRTNEADRRDEDEGEQHRRRQAVDPAQYRPAGDTMREDDVHREEPGVREGERDADRLAEDTHVRQQVDAGRSRHHRREVPPDAGGAQR